MKKFLFISLLLACTFYLNAQKIKLVKFSSGYSKPVDIENCGDKRLFIVEEQGKIFICDSAGTRNPTPYLDITDRVLFNGGEQGLLGLAFDPNYATNGFFYVNYIDTNGNTRISKFSVKTDDPNLAKKNTEVVLLTIPQPFTNHNGGGIRFGPDGYLYIGMGDGGDAGDPFNNSQNPMSLLGKMLRIDVHRGTTYKNPSDNPFVDSPNYRHEIWAMGLRNPWRWSFDALTGAMWIGDVGQDSWEEVDLQLHAATGGRNYGWRCYEGKHPYDTTGCLPQADYKAPVYEYSHSDSTGDCSVIGGFVYRGTLFSSLFGKYIFVDYCSGYFRLLYVEHGKTRVKIAGRGETSAYTSFGENASHEIYVCNGTNGSIYHVTDTSFQQSLNYSSAKTPNKLSLSPNPSNGHINITYASLKTENVAIRITSLLGNAVYNTSKFVNTGNNTWSMNINLPKGNYYFSIISSSGILATQSLRIE